MGFWRSLKEFVFTKNASHVLVVDGNSGSSKTIDWSAGNKHKLTLTADCTLTFTAPKQSCNLLLEIIQDGTGGWTITYPATVKWFKKTLVDPTATASATSVLTLFFNGTNYLTMMSDDFG